MHFIKLNTIRQDSGVMVYGTGRPIGVHYTVPLEFSEPFFKSSTDNYYYNWSEMAEIALFLAHPECEELPSCLWNFGLKFSWFGYEEYVKPLLAANFWEINLDRGQRTDPILFWSCSLGNDRQASEKDVAHMLHQLFKPEAHQVDENTKMVMFKGNSKELKGVLLNERANEQKLDASSHTVKHLLGLPNEYLIAQFSSGFCKSGTWRHKNGSGVTTFNGERWALAPDTYVSFVGKTKGAANQKLLKFLRSVGKEYNPLWAKPYENTEGTEKEWRAHAMR